MVRMSDRVLISEMIVLKGGMCHGEVSIL